jgi:alkylation response protein AidB-like acyl-CoA dehydrogenase
MQLGQGYYKLLDPRYKYSTCYCTEEEIEIALNVARFVDKEMMPERHNFEGGWNHDEKLAIETRNRFYKECVKMDLTKTNFPKELGGLGLSTVVRNMIYEELCRADVGMAMEVMHIHWPVSFMVAAKRDDLLKEFAPYMLGDDAWMACVAITERAGGANVEDPAFDFRTLRTTLRIEGDTAIVNGVKIWPGTSGNPDRFKEDQYLKGHLGYWTIVTRDPSQGSKSAGIVYVPADAEGFSASPPYKKMGLCWQDENCELYFENVRVPKRYVIDTEPGQGAKIIKGYCVGLGRLGVSSRLIGIAEAVLKIALDWTGGRDIAGVPVRERSYFASILAEMAKRVEVARNYMLMCSWQVGRPEIYGTPDSPEMIAKFSAARSFAGNVCEFVVNRAMEMMGSYGYSYDYHVEKYMRDYKIIQMVLGGPHRDMLDVAQGLYGPFKWSGMDEWIKKGGLVTEGFDGPRY